MNYLKFGLLSKFIRIFYSNLFIKNLKVMKIYRIPNLVDEVASRILKYVEMS